MSLPDGASGTAYGGGVSETHPGRGTVPVDLVRPSLALGASWRSMAAEFEGGHIDGAAVVGRVVADLDDPAVFAAWLAEVAAHERGEQVPDGFVPATLRWVVSTEDPTTVLGSIQLRHELNAFLLEVGGHIGYAVRPSARRRGVATAALAAMLEVARSRGLERVLVTCDVDNLGSIGTIEGNGGVLEDERAGKRRYWISLLQ